MAFVVSTSKPPTACLGLACGRFADAHTTYLAVNRGSCLSFYRVEAGEARHGGGEGASTSHETGEQDEEQNGGGVNASDVALGDLVHVQDYKLCCTLKYIQAVPLLHPDTGVLLRHVLFLFSVKQEVSLVVLSWASQARRAGKRGRGEAAARVRCKLVTLYHSGVEECLYQLRPSDVDLVCSSTTHAFMRAGGGRLMPGLRPAPPFVAFAVGRSEVYFLDVLAALGAPQRGSRRAKHRLDSLLPASLVALAEERGKLPCLSVSAFHSTEFEVRDVGFGLLHGSGMPAEGGAATATTAADDMAAASATAGTTASAVPFYVLFADHHGRVHVSRYLFRSGTLTTATMTEQPPTSRGRSEAAVVPPLPFLRGTALLTVAATAERLCRRDLLQSNVDTTASRLLVSPRGVYVVGTQLVTCIQTQRERKRVVTRPMPLGGPARELTCACLDDRGELLVCASGGAVARLRGCRGEEGSGKMSSGLTPMRHDVAGAAEETTSVAELGEERGGRVWEGGSTQEKEDLACLATTQLPTIPTCAVAVTATMSVVGSQFANTLLLHRAPNGGHRHRTLIEHCGPIMDMTVVRDGPRTSVVASTGIDGGGGISLVRAAVKVTEQVVIPLLTEARGVLYAHRLLVLLFYGFSRFFVLTVQGSSRLLAELTLVEEAEAEVATPQRDGDDAHLEPSSLSNLLALHYDKQSGRYLALHEAGASWLRVDAARGTVRRDGAIAVQGGAGEARVPALPLLFAAASSALCLVSDGSDIVALRDFARLPHHWHVEGGVSALAIVSATQFVYGDWHSGALALCDVTRGTVTAQLVLVSPVRSVCVVRWGDSQAAARGSGHPRRRHRRRRRSAEGEPGTTVDDDSGAVRLVVGTLDGHIAEMSLSSLREGQLLQLLLLKNEPVELGVLRGGEGILGFGDVPLVVLQRPEGLQVTGLTMQGVIACAALDDDDSEDDDGDSEDAEGQDGPYYAFLCRQSATLAICTLGEVQKMDRTVVTMGHTVTHVSFVPAWGGFVLALREAETDEIVYMPYAALERAQQGTPRLPWPQTRLLEYERCVFVEPLVLGAAHTSPPRAERLCATSATEEADNYVVLVGSCFAFPDDHQARSSRIMWFQLDAQAAGTLRQLGAKDIAGALQCCCVVPHYRGRIALGISGYVVLYNWSAVDGTFIAEDRCRVGLAITKLIPVFDQSSQAPQLQADLVPAGDAVAAGRGGGGTEEGGQGHDTAMLVALDARHSAMFVAVNQLQGSLSVQGREAQLRGVMDGVVLPPQHLAMCDEMMNFFFMANELRCEADPQGGTTRGVAVAAAAEPAGGGPHVVSTAAAAGETTPPRYRLVTQAQGHIGDLVTAMQLGSFAPSAVSSEYVPTPRALIAGITGPQLIYGTAHGGFGTLTPVGHATFLFLRAMELALWEVLTPHGGYEHDYYREVLRLGQERGLNRSVSLDANVLASGTTAAQQQQQQQQQYGSPDGSGGDASPHRASTAAQNFCDGDAIEAYLLLKESKRQRVRWTAATTTVNWFAALLVAAPSSPSSPTVTKSAAVTTDVRRWGLLLAQAPPTQLPLAPQRELLDRCNEFLASEALPRLPYEDAAVEAFILTLQRVH